MADVIKNFPSRLHKMTQVFYREVPSQVATRRFIDTLTNLLFPVRDKRNISLKEMDLRISSTISWRSSARCAPTWTVAANISPNGFSAKSR